MQNKKVSKSLKISEQGKLATKRLNFTVLRSLAGKTGKSLKFSRKLKLVIFSKDRKFCSLSRKKNFVVYGGTCDFADFTKSRIFPHIFWGGGGHKYF